MATYQYAQQQFQLNVGSTLQQILGFRPQSVVVDNPTAYWIYLVDALRYVPPGYFGVVIPLRNAVAANVQWIDPTTGNPEIGQGTAYFTFTEATLAPDSGNTKSVEVTGGTIDVTITNVGPLDVNVTNASLTITGNVNIVNAVIPVSGTVSISGTVAVSVSGTANVNITNASIAITGAVSISGTPAVTISGTPNVNITNASIAVTGTVGISGTINANITAGTVNIQNVTNGTIQSAGGLRYLGSLTVAPGATGTKNVVITSFERAILIACPPANVADAASKITVQTTSGANIFSLIGMFSGEQIAIAYVNPSVTTGWSVSAQNLENSGSGNKTYYIFADTELPVTRIDQPIKAARRRPTTQFVVSNATLSGTSFTLGTYQSLGSADGALPLISKFYLAATVLNATLTNGEMVVLTVDDGTKFYYLANVMVAAGQSVVINKEFSEPVDLSSILNPGLIWNFTITGSHLSGTVGVKVSASVDLIIDR